MDYRKITEAALEAVIAVVLPVRRELARRVADVMSQERFISPGALTATYAAIAGGWIVGSDVALAIWEHEFGAHLLPSVAKGLFFVGVTSWMLHALATRMVRHTREQVEELRVESQREAAAQLARANRLYATLARANEAAVGATERARLCEEICHALVECAGMRLAWIGWVDEGTRLVRVESSAGPAREYLEGVTISVNPALPEARGPTGRAILEETAVVCQDIASDEVMRPWRARAMSFGFRSSASIPVRDPAGRRGALTMHADEVGFFNEEIVRLIEQLAHDLSHGLDVLTARQKIDLQTAALRESELVNRITFEHAAVGIAHLSLEGRWLRVNRRLCTILGYAAEDLLAMTFEDIVTVGDGDRDLRVARRVLEGGLTFYRVEKQYLRKDHTPVFVNLSLSLVRDAAGAAKYFIAVIEDVSERRAAEQSLRESDARLRLALQASQQGIWDMDIDTQKVIVSPEYAEILGYDPAEFAETGRDWVARVHPDDRESAERIFQDYLQGRRPDYRVECRQRTKQGEWKWIVALGRVVEHHADGRPRRMLGIQADITERRSALERLELLYTALQAVPAGIVITDHTGRIEWVNDAFTQLTGYARGEALGGNPRLLKSGRHDANFYAELWGTITRGQVWSGELHNRRKDGTEYQERMIVAPVTYQGSGITHYIAIKQDITEAKRLEQQLLRSQRMEGIGLLAGGIAHDLNNVLAPILLSVELMRMRAKEPADRRALDVIESAGRRGSGVVKQVLTFARGIDGDRAPLRPRDLIRELVMIIEETFPRDIIIRREAGSDIPMVSGDPTQLHQVLLNLAVNARDAMPQGGTLTFRLQATEVQARRNDLTGAVKPGPYVVIAVQDSGSGMPESVRERIFEPFFTTKPQGKGTGLGLPTVLGIVRSHGGFIEVDSAPGQGSEFRVYLPALPVEKSDSTPPMVSLAPQGAGRTVLVCDDEPAIREVAELVLRNVGFEVLLATNGREAVELFARTPDRIDLVLMDLMMPIMTGDRAAVEIQQRRPGVPVLFMSGLMEAEMLQAALKNAASSPVALLRKPFAATELLDRVAKALPPRAG